MAAITVWAVESRCTSQPCTGLSQVAITGIKELGSNAILFCNDCISNHKRDWILEAISTQNQKAEFDLDSTIQNLKTEIFDSVEKHVNIAVEKTAKTMQTEIEKALGKKPEVSSNKQLKPDKTGAPKAAYHSIASCVRIQGVSEDPKKSMKENNPDKLKID